MSHDCVYNWLQIDIWTLFLFLSDSGILTLFLFTHNIRTISVNKLESAPIWIGIIGLLLLFESFITHSFQWFSIALFSINHLFHASHEGNTITIHHWFKILDAAKKAFTFSFLVSHTYIFFFEVSGITSLGEFVITYTSLRPINSVRYISIIPSIAQSGWFEAIIHHHLFGIQKKSQDIEISSHFFLLKMFNDLSHFILSTQRF